MATDDRKDVERLDGGDLADENRDAITGAPGSHPVGTGVGAAGGGLAAAAAGAAIGSAVPGIGTVAGGIVGAVVGAVGGGLAGKGVAESVNPTAEEAYWRDEHRNRPYYEPGRDYETDYAPAYRYGYEARSQHGARSFDDVHPHLEQGWDSARQKSQLSWEKAKHAARDAWERVEQPGSPARETDRDRAIRESSVNVAPRTGDNDLVDNSSHPVGTTVGAAGGGVGGAAAGAALGTAVAPGVGTAIGAVAGAVGGAVAGGAVGHGVAEAINPTEEDNYWRMNYTSRPYYSAEYNYDEDYAPAYRYGVESYTRHPGRRFDEVESDLGSGWERTKGKSRLGWDRAKLATRDAWHKVERAMPGDYDRDGR